MAEPDEILQAARHVVVQDYPSRDIPDALTRAGFEVTIYGGPAEADVVISELSDGDVVHRQLGRYPDQADLFYTYRPLAEIDAIIPEAQRLGAGTLWRQPQVEGEDEASTAVWRAQVEAAGLAYLDSPPIDEVARSLRRN
jgi:predicted CoA-binding protein